MAKMGQYEEKRAKYANKNAFTVYTKIILTCFAHPYSA